MSLMNPASYSVYENEEPDRTPLISSDFRITNGAFDFTSVRHALSQHPDRSLAKLVKRYVANIEEHPAEVKCVNLKAIHFISKDNGPGKEYLVRLENLSYVHRHYTSKPRHMYVVIETQRAAARDWFSILAKSGSNYLRRESRAPTPEAEAEPEPELEPTDTPTPAPPPRFSGICSGILSAITMMNCSAASLVCAQRLIGGTMVIAHPSESAVIPVVLAGMIISVWPIDLIWKRPSAMYRIGALVLNIGLAYALYKLYQPGTILITN